MISDPTIYFVILIAGAFAAAFVIGAVGFADALILNAVWLHIMDASAAIPLIVTCGFLMHVIPLFKLRKSLDFSKLPPFAFMGLAGVPIGVWALTQTTIGSFKLIIGVMLVVYGTWMLFRPNLVSNNIDTPKTDGVVGLIGGFMGGFAGLSGLFPTLWVGAKNWSKNTQRGVFQPFVIIMHAVGIITFAFSGMIGADTLRDLAWCLPAIAIGSWVGVKTYPYLNDKQFRQIILGLILVSGITLLL